MAFKSKHKRKKRRSSMWSSSSESDSGSNSPPNRSQNPSYQNGVAAFNRKQNTETDSLKLSQMKFEGNVSIEGGYDIGMDKTEKGCSRRRGLRVRKSVLCSENMVYGEEECLINTQGNSGGGTKRRNSSQGRKIKGRRKGPALSVRSSAKLADFTTEKKQTVLSWLIDSGTVQENERVWYMDRNRIKLEGQIKREGILCTCCNRVITVSEFEIHGGSSLCQPYKNTFIETGISLLQCQIDAWDRQKTSARFGFQNVEFQNGDNDPYDDVCAICVDGGDLICCSHCSSTFHNSCMGIHGIPQGDWHCPNCLCKFCGVDASCIAQLLTCFQCEKKYHRVCAQDSEILVVDRNSQCSSFCGQNCRKLFEQLQKLLGVKNEVDAGLSWTFIRRLNQDSNTSVHGLSQRVEYNSKLAVALTVMEECFEPIIDRRSGINIVHNVVYNCGSNFNRLNYSGFYTAILERDDEIISAATIRIHGARLAEMPFIGTREIYRGQGMCRRLLNAIESALCFLNVEKLFIPSISERVETWTRSFGFKPIEESLYKELRSLNVLKFLDAIPLQKILPKRNSNERNAAAGRALKASALQSNNHNDKLGGGNKFMKAAPFDLNLEPSKRVEVKNTEIAWRKRLSWGVFLTLHEDCSIRCTRLRV